MHAVDIEVPVREKREIHNAVFKKDDTPAFELQTVLFTLYYPITRSVKTRKHHYWVPKPLWLTAVGYAKVAHISNWLTDNIFTGAMGVLVGSTRTPAEVDAPFVSSEDYLRQVAAYVDDYGAKQIVMEGEEIGLPIVIFSHGMASRRRDYSEFERDRTRGIADMCRPVSCRAGLARLCGCKHRAS